MRKKHRIYNRIFKPKIFFLNNSKHNNDIHYNNILSFSIHEIIYKKNNFNVVMVTDNFIKTIKKNIYDREELKNVENLYCSILDKLDPRDYIQEQTDLIINIFIDLFKNEIIKVLFSETLQKNNDQIMNVLYKNIYFLSPISKKQ